MRLVVFNAMKLCSNLCGIRVKSLRQRLRYSGELAEDLYSLARERRHAHGIEEFPSQPRVGVPRDGHVVDILQFQPRFFQAITNRLCREAGGVLNAVEAFFFDGSHKPASRDNGCRRVAVIGIYAKNVHREWIQSTSAAPHHAASCRELTPAPLIENIQRPRARPGSLAFEKRCPNAAHAFRAKVGRKRWRDIRKTTFQPWAQRSTKPFFPRQRKCFFSLPKNFFR